MWVRFSSISVLLLSVLGDGCSTERQLSGVYASNQIPYSFEIYENQTFSYRYKFQFAYEYSYGSWKRTSKNTILINSGMNTRRIPVDYKNLSDTNVNTKDRYRLYISMKLDEKERQYYKCLVYANETLYKSIRCDSFQLLEFDRALTNIHFGITADSRIPARFLDTLYTQSIHLDANSGVARINLLYNDSLFNYRLFNNQSLNITERKLEFYDSSLRQLIVIPKAKPRWTD